MSPSSTATPRPDNNIEVICPLKLNNGAGCRKKCNGEKRFRSMQEHIRRAHPEYYIPKLPATEESFLLMINSDPADPPKHQPSLLPSSSPSKNSQSESQPLPSTDQESYAVDWLQGKNSSHSFNNNSSSPWSRKGSVSKHAAQVLTQMQQRRTVSDESPQQPSSHPRGNNNNYSWDTDVAGASNSDSTYLPNIYQAFVSGAYPDENRLAPISPRPLPLADSRLPTVNSPLAPSPLFYRSATLPPVSSLGNANGVSNNNCLPRFNRPRKTSISQNARKPKHERVRSKDHSVRPLGFDRKALSVEPQTLSPALASRRWDDLVDAATSATGEVSRDTTPVPSLRSPNINNRASLPPPLQPPFGHHLIPSSSYISSPLHRAHTPPSLPPSTDLNSTPYLQDVESSITSSKSGTNFHIPASGLSDTSPPTIPSILYPPLPSSYSGAVTIYCAACRKPTPLRNESYACTECVRGFCKDCVDAIYLQQQKGRASGCPKCDARGGKFKPFQLDIR